MTDVALRQPAGVLERSHRGLHPFQGDGVLQHVQQGVDVLLDARFEQHPDHLVVVEGGYPGGEHVAHLTHDPVAVTVNLGRHQRHPTGHASPRL